jgi:type II secretory pathway pseudopilin PulG
MTLLEVLVTLVIVSMVAGLSMQAFQQFARVERLLEDAGSDGQQRMLRREWLRQLVAATLPEQISMPLQFSGDARGFQLRSSRHPDAMGHGPLRVELDYDAQARSTTLRLRALQPGKAASLVLLTWPGEPPDIRYQDKAGAWHERWPMANADPEATRRPPALVRIDVGPEAGGILLLPIVGTEVPRPRLADWSD